MNLDDWEADASKVASYNVPPNTLSKHTQELQVRVLALIKALRKAEEGLKKYAGNLLGDSTELESTRILARETLAEIEGILNG